MDAPYSPRSRAERLIAGGRVVLASFSLLAICLDPSEPSRHANVAYALLAAYVAYSLLVALWVWRWEIALSLLGLATHVLDLATFSLFMYYTEGPTSPFFVYFVFSVICAALRWQWRGTVWTALAALAAFVSLGIYATEVLNDPGFELNRFIIRGVYLAVAGALLGYLAAYEQRLRSEIYKLSSWPQSHPQEMAALLREALETAAGILGAPRVVLAWEEPEEPWHYLACWSRGKFDWTHHAPGAFGLLVAEPLFGASFLCNDARSPFPTVLHTSPEGFTRWSGKPLEHDLEERFAAKTVLSLPVNGESLQGRLFSLDKRGMTSDDLVLGEIVARQVATRLDHFYLLQQIQQAAASEERIRLARDLHDGLLQSLTGAALQLQTLPRLMQENPAVARQRLVDIQRLVAAEQRDLRFFIQELRPAAPGPPGADLSLTARLQELGDRFQRHWGLQVELKLDPPEQPIWDRLARQIYSIIHEALVNAARHAGASVARVEIGLQENQVRIVVADNGHGFAFRGRYDHATVAKLKLGPGSLRERITSLQGTLTLDSSESGARLEISLPLARQAAEVESDVRPGVGNAH